MRQLGIGCALAATFLFSACDGENIESSQEVTVQSSVLEEQEAPTVGRFDRAEGIQRPALAPNALTCQSSVPGERREVVIDEKSEFSANLQQEVRMAEQRFVRNGASREGLR